MKETIYYCDYCGKQTNYRKAIRPHWIRYILNGANAYYETIVLEGDGCVDCFNSYKKWVKSRRVRKE